MTIYDAIEVLRKHNEWRRYSGEIDKSPEMTDPATLGKAIDTVVEHFADESKDERIRSCIGLGEISYVGQEEELIALKNNLKNLIK